MVKSISDTKVPKQLSPGRPRNPENKASFETKAPKVTSELPKDIVGSHMGMMHPMAGPAIKNPVKPPKLGPKAPPK